MKALVGAFNQEKALVGAFSVITNLRMDRFTALEKRDDLLLPREVVSGVRPAAHHEVPVAGVPPPVPQLRAARPRHAAAPSQPGGQVARIGGYVEDDILIIHLSNIWFDIIQ